jgi:hypothetical protein
MIVDPSFAMRMKISPRAPIFVQAHREVPLMAGNR